MFNGMAGERTEVVIRSVQVQWQGTKCTRHGINRFDIHLAVLIRLASLHYPDLDQLGYLELRSVR